MKGRKPKPAALRLVEGTFRADRHRIGVEFASEPPHMPEWLDAEAVAEWERVCPMLAASRVLTPADAGVLAAYCDAYAKWLTAERGIQKLAKMDDTTGGLLVKTTNGNLIQNPLVGVANRAKADMVKYAAELGMTPAARSRVSPAPEQHPGDPAESYFK